MTKQSNGRLDGKVAIVTGAGSSGPGIGTGKAISILFAREGAQVLLVDQNLSAAEETLDTVLSEGGDARLFQADLTSDIECKSMIEAAREHYGRVHVLVNNVGIRGPGSVTDTSEDEWDRVMDVNLKSMMLASKHTVPVIIEGGGGSIVNLSSVSGIRSTSHGAGTSYSVSKGGVIALTTSMAVEHGRDNVRVNCIAPGHIYTPMVAGDISDDMRDLRRRAAPLGLEGTAWDVAWAAVFLSSDEARWVSGVVLPVDGGLLATTPLAMLPHLR